MKKLICTLLCVIMLAGLFTTGASAATVWDSNADDNPSQAIKVKVGDTIKGTLSYEDKDYEDYFKLTLSQRTKLTIRIEADDYAELYLMEYFDSTDYFYIDSLGTEWDGSGYSKAFGSIILEAGTYLLNPYYDGYGYSDISYKVTITKESGTSTGWEYDGMEQEWVYIKNGNVLKNAWVKDGYDWAYTDENGYHSREIWVEDSSGQEFLLSYDGYLARYYWVYDHGEGRYNYLGEDGLKVKNAWIYDGHGWAYMDADGYDVYDTWKKDSKGWVYINDSGYMATSDVVPDKNGLCFVGKDGYLVKNAWGKSWDGYWYHTDKTGHIEYNKWIKDSKGWCYVGDEGKMLTSTLALDSKGLCFVGKDGYLVKNAWGKSWDGYWYHTDKTGHIEYNKWIKDSKGWVYVGETGRMLTNFIVADSTGWCYVGSNGYCVTNKWVDYNGDWYYFDGNGHMVTDKWVKDSVGWCYLTESGYMATLSWVKDSAGWCYVGSDGYCVTGTYVIDGVEYTFKDNGQLIGPEPAL